MKGGLFACPPVVGRKHVNSVSCCHLGLAQANVLQQAKLNACAFEFFNFF